MHIYDVYIYLYIYIYIYNYIYIYILAIEELCSQIKIHSKTIAELERNFQNIRTRGASADHIPPRANTKKLASIQVLDICKKSWNKIEDSHIEFSPEMNVLDASSFRNSSLGIRTPVRWGGNEVTSATPHSPPDARTHSPPSFGHGKSTKTTEINEFQLDTDNYKNKLLKMKEKKRSYKERNIQLNSQIAQLEYKNNNITHDVSKVKEYETIIYEKELYIDDLNRKLANECATDKKEQMKSLENVLKKKCEDAQIIHREHESIIREKDCKLKDAYDQNILIESKHSKRITELEVANRNMETMVRAETGNIQSRNLQLHENNQKFTQIIIEKDKEIQEIQVKFTKIIENLQDKEIKEIEKSKEKIKKILGENEDLQNNIRIEKNKIEKEKTEVQNYKTRCETKMAEISEKDLYIQNLNIENEQLKQSMNELLKAKAEMNKHLTQKESIHEETLTGKNKIIDKKIISDKKLKEELAKLRSEIAKLEAKVQTQNEEIAKLKQESTYKANIISDQIANEATMSKNLEKLTNENSELKAKIQKNEKLIPTYEAQISSYELKLGRLINEIGTKEENLMKGVEMHVQNENNLKSTINKLQEIIKKKEDSINLEQREKIKLEYSLSKLTESDDESDINIDQKNQIIDIQEKIKKNDQEMEELTQKNSELEAENIVLQNKESTDNEEIICLRNRNKNLEDEYEKNARITEEYEINKELVKTEKLELENNKKELMEFKLKIGEFELKEKEMTQKFMEEKESIENDNRKLRIKTIALENAMKLDK